MRSASARVRTVCTGEMMAGAAEPARRTAGRPDQVAIADRLASRRDLAGGGIDMGDAAAEEHRDIAFLPEGGRTDQQAIESLVPGEIFLGQRRAFVGQIRLVADNGDAAAELRLAQRDRRLRAAVAGADDHNVVAVHRSSPIADFVWAFLRGRTDESKRQDA